MTIPGSPRKRNTTGLILGGILIAFAVLGIVAMTVLGTLAVTGQIG